MKKSLLVLSILFLSVSFAGISAADLNPYAYDLKVLSTDAENFKVTLQYSLNAPASSVKIYAKDGTGTSYLLKEFGSRSATTYTVEIDLMDAMINKGVPAGEDLSWYVDVKCAARSASTEACGKKINFRSPFSIDIDNNPQSPYFGRIVTTQANSNETRGVRAYKPNFTQIGSNYIGSIVKFPSGNWYDYTHLTPFRIRVLQDGTGRIFVSSADVGQSTYMWQVNPANLNEWSVFLTSAQMITLTKHAEGDDTMANHNFDFRQKENGEWELLLLSSSVNSKSTNCSSGYSYCGVYALGSDLSKKNYTQYIENKEGAPHKYIDDWFVASVLTGNAQFDPNGNILYSSYQQSKRPEESALIHQQRSNNTFATTYNTFERLKRKNTSNGGIRYSADFSKLAVGCGNDAKEVSICNASHSNGYLTISSLNEVDMITSSHNGAYIVDFAWDYASNLYACVRNSDDSSLRGVWVIACNLNGAAVSTPARDKFSIPCDPDKDCTVTCTATTGGRIVNGFSGGTQKACTEMTVKAEPVDNNYKFDKWTDQSGKTVSTNSTYTFRVLKDVQLTAHFSGAVFNVTWWNLFQNGEDIAKESTAYPHTNERLWRLYQLEFKKYHSDARNNQTDLTNNGKKQFDVGGFLYNRAGVNVEFLKDQNQPFHWLYNYLNFVNGKTILATTNFTLANRFQYFPYLFFNRADTAFNSSLANSNPYCNGVDFYKTEFWKYENGKYDKSKKFKDYGKATYWRPWWTEGVCGLPKTYNYADDMPVTWKQNACATGTVPGMSSNKETTPSQWYKWNTGGANQLLAWREGGTNPVNNRIVHHVDKSMALYATYVDKHLQEDDPEPQNQYDAKNDDVRMLLANSKYGASTLHDITVDRKFVGGMYNTICLPFDVYYDKLPAALIGAEIKKFSTVDHTMDEYGDPVAILRFVDAQPTSSGILMEAGKPYLIKPKADVNAAYLTYGDVKYWSVKGSGNAYGETAGGVVFQGIFNPTTLSPGDCILVADNRLAKVTNTSEKLKGFRAYFKIEDAYLQSLADDGRVYLSMKKPVTSSVPVAPEAEKLEAPKARKIMRDGQIYILRGDEVYTVGGLRVK